MPDPDRELDRLLAAHLDDALDPADAAALHARLRAEPAARLLLVEAATQAAGLPLARTRARASRRWLGWTALAAALAAAVLAGTLLLPAHRGPLLASGGGMRLERDGGSLPAGGALRPGDLVVAGEQPAVLAWSDEATRLTLAPGGRLAVLADRGAKRLRLELGSLRAEVAAQGPEGGLAIATADGQVEVVGTRFSVAVEAGATRVGVEHGTVRLRCGEAAPVLLPAGFAAVLAGGRVGQAVPLMQPPGPSAGGGPVVIVPAELADAAGFEGAVDGDAVVTVGGSAAPDYTRMQIPYRLAGYAAYADDLVVSIDLASDRATTVALVAMVGRGDRGEWLGNLQGEQAVAAGSRTVAFPLARMRRIAGFDDPAARDLRLVGAAVMAWSPGVPLRVRRITIAPAGAGSAP